MKTALVITPRVIQTINSLPEEERLAVATAFVGEMVLGADINEQLTPMQAVIFSIIKSYVKSDCAKLGLNMPAEAV